MIGYAAAARTAAQLLASTSAARAIYLAGSAADPRHLKLGLSDLDLVVVADLPDTEAELAFIEQLRARHRALGAFGPLFHNLEYFDSADLACSQRWDRWTAEAWGWQRLTGRELRATVELSESERALGDLRECVRRWAKGAVRLGLGEGSDAGAVRHHLWRLWRDCVACAAGASSHRTLEELRDHPGVPPSVWAVHERSAPGDILVAAWTALAARLPAAEGAWLAQGEAVLPEVPRRAWQPTADALRAAGLPDPIIAPRGGSPTDQVLVALVPDVSDIPRALRALATVPPLPMEHFTWARRPILVPIEGATALAFLPPAPFAAINLAFAAQGARSSGWAVPAPSADVQRQLVRAEVVNAFHRLRGLRLRLHKDPQVLIDRFDAALCRVLPAWAQIQDHGVWRVDTPEDLPPRDDRDRITRLRAWVAERRAKLPSC